MKTIIHLEQVAENSVICEVEGSGEDLGVMLTSFLVSRPDVLKFFEVNIGIAKEMLAEHERGEVDLTKMLESVPIKEGKH